MRRVAPSTWMLGLAVVAIPAIIMLALRLDYERPSIELVEGPDPRATNELPWLGGGSLEPMLLADLPARSTLVISAIVQDVKRARLNTPDGTLLTAPIDARGPENRILPLTDVVLDIRDVLGQADDGSIRPGTTLEITVVGGLVTHVVNDPAASAALGLLEVNGASTIHPDPVDGKPLLPPDGPETEVHPTGPITVSSQIVPTEVLAEGEEVVLFLAEHEMHVAGQTQSELVWMIAHTQGIFRLGSDDVGRNDFGVERTISELQAMAGSLAAQDG